MFRSSSLWQPLLQGLLILLAMVLVWDIAANLIAEGLWFQEVGYLGVFIKGLETKFILWLLSLGISVLFLVGNILLAKSRKHEPGDQQKTISRPLPLKLLLPLLLFLGLMVGMMVWHYGQIALEVWQPELSLLNIAPPLPTPLKERFTELFAAVVNKNLIFWQIGVLVAVGGALIINLEFTLVAVAVALSLVFSLVISGNWTRFLQYLHPTTFQTVDPLFSLDASFYIFRLPLWQLVNFWCIGLCFYAASACTMIYLRSGHSISRGKFPGFSLRQLRHLYYLGSSLMLCQAAGHWLKRYGLVYSRRGASYGASYTDVNVQLPAETGLAVLAFSVALWLGWRAIRSRNIADEYGVKKLENNPQVTLLTLSSALTAIGFYILASILFAVVFPLVVQRLEVQPNELAREKPYILRSIDYTKKAFDLERITEKDFDPQGNLQKEDIEENELTIKAIRLWDTRPLLETNRQLQQIRLYYRFPEADIDRYTIRSKEEETAKPTFRQQVIIAPRELDYDAVPAEAKTWVNKRLVYTHGYGFTMSPVNRVDEGGLPFYFVKDIGAESAEEKGVLRTSSPAIRNSIPIGKPRIYYGQLTDNHIMTSTTIREFDFPTGQENVYNTYDGKGGIPLGNYLSRTIFATYLQDWQMLFTDRFTPKTKVLFRREIKLRSQAIAPFLRYDQDPYLVTADTSEAEDTEAPNYLYWIIDAYTTSDHYPYADPGKNEFNYIRNSVKVVIDAYNGDVHFYVSDPDDPIIQAWQRIFPDIFQPLEEMPVTLYSHIRYPIDLLTVQSERLLTYHMSDAQVFYNREDQWQIPQEIYGDEPRTIEPYYLILKLPDFDSVEFVLLHPYTPQGRNNLIAWLAGRSGSENYNELFLYQFPKQRLVYGPEQVESLINQDPVISQQISLWNRQGSRAVQGNLLMIPIENSLLYVEPLYLEAEKNSLPILARVVAVYENRIVMAATLNEALEALFGEDEESATQPEQPILDVPKSTILRRFDQELFQQEQNPSPGGGEEPPAPTPVPQETPE